MLFALAVEHWTTFVPSGACSGKPQSLLIQSTWTFQIWRGLMIGTPGVLWGTLRESVVPGYSVPVWTQWELWSHSRIKLSVFPVGVGYCQGCDAKALAPILLLVISTHSQGQECVRLGASGSHLCMSQMMWCSWPPQSMTFSMHWKSLQLSMKRLG